MAKVKYDVTGVESGGGDIPKPGMYEAKLVECTRRTGQKNDLAVKYEIIKPKANKGFPLYDYVPLTEAAAFRLRQFLEAVGLVEDGGKEKGTFDTEKVLGTKVQVRVKHEHSDEYGTKARPAAVLPLGSGDGDDEEDLDDEEGEEDGPDLDDLDRSELKKLIKAKELEVKVLKKDSDDDIREKIKEALAEGEEEEPDEPEGDDDEDGDDYDEWSMKELKDELKSRELETSGNKKSVLIGRLRKDDESDEDPFEED